MNHVTILIAVIAAIMSMCHAQDTMPTARTPPTCRQVQMRFSFIMCDDENPDEFEEKQCRPAVGGAVCYCVDPMSGDRVDGRTYTRDEIDEIDCDSDDRDNDRRDMMCPDLADRIRECGGIDCIRRPNANANETCVQCIERCTSTGEDPACRRDSDCDEGERCIISGDLGQPDCVNVRMIQENQPCTPEDDDDDDDDDDYDDDDDDGDDDDDDDDGDGDDDYNDEEETFFERSTRDFDRRSELGERECADNLVCRRNAVHTAICQNRTGPCFDNDRRPPRSNSSVRQLECDDDSGNFEARQNNGREQWCVSPMNGMEIPGTRRQRSMRLDCNRMVFQDCRIMINGRRYTVEHGEEAINFNMMRGMCGFCRCNNGSFAFCRQVECPYIRDDSGSQSCDVNGRTIPHRMTYEDDCNMCRCINGNVRCTDRDCSDDEDDDDDDEDGDNEFAGCRRMPISPVCATNMRTYPNKCTALAAGFERFEITPGACSRNSICERFPCMDGYRCIALSASCTGRNCTARDFRKCINTTRLMCRAESDLSMRERVCGANNRTYPSICHMVQQSSTQIRFAQGCNRSDCPDIPVCGTDGVTYRSICDIRLQPDVRFDYRGACMTTRNETVRNFCARVRNSNRCTMRQNCNTTVRPTDGCCPVCGGGVTVGIDGEALDRFSEEFDDARTTSEVRRKMTDSDIVRDTSNKCTIEAQFASNGNIDLLYEANKDEDASTCAAKARMAADNINNLGRPNTSRRRRQTEGDEPDPIFNLVTVATTLETTVSDTTDTTNPPGGDGGASVIFVSYSLLFALMLLAMLMF